MRSQIPTRTNMRILKDPTTNIKELYQQEATSLGTIQAPFSSPASIFLLAFCSLPVQNCISQPPATKQVPPTNDEISNIQSRAPGVEKLLQLHRTTSTDPISSSIPGDIPGFSNRATARNHDPLTYFPSNC